MILASLPFVRYVQMISGSPSPFFLDTQSRTFVALVLTVVAVLTTYRVFANGDGVTDNVREVMFNVTSIASGTGYASTDYQLWGPLPVVIFFFLGLIGGAAGSTCCSVKVFRYQILFSSIAAQVRRIHSPNGIFTPRFEGRPVSEDVLSSVMAFFMLFVVTLGLLSVALGATGLDFITSVSGPMLGRVSDRRLGRREPSRGSATSPNGSSFSPCS